MDFTQKLDQAPGKTFLQYTSLNIISMLSFSLYIFADTFFIANGVGQDGLVALNLALPLYSIMNACALMVATGSATKYAICLGEGNQEGACKVFTLAFRFGLGMGIFFLLLGNLASVPLMKLLGAEGEIIEMSAIYIRTLLTFSPAVFLAS